MSTTELADGAAAAAESDKISVTSCSPTEESKQAESSSSIPAGSSDLSSAKIDILLKAAGNAPILQNKKWSVERLKKVASIITFVRKLLKCDAQSSLYLYVNQSFAPAPDVDIGTLYECFGSNGKLIFHYCTTQAWG